MSRLLKRYVPAALFAAFAVVLLGLSSGAQAARQSQRHTRGYYPPLMQNWQVFGPLKTQASTTVVYAKFVVGLNYPGFLGAYYKAIGRKDIIPAMWTQLVLPDGMQLLNSGSFKSRFSDLGYKALFQKPIPKTNLRWGSIRGVPTWKVLNVAEGILPRAVFWVSGQPGQCLKATTKGMARHKRRWVRIPHAPVQTSADKCLPGTLPTTTTTSASG